MDGANHHALPFPAAPKHSGKEFSLIIIIIIIFLPFEEVCTGKKQIAMKLYYLTDTYVNTP